jgi:hypothetical protein
MALTTAQLATLKTAILAETDATFVGYRTNGQTTLMADWYNAPSNPSFIVYRRSVSTDEVGKTVNYVAVEALTDLNRGRIDTFYVMNPLSFSPERSDIRTFWANVFSGALGGQGQATRDALEALWRRTATRGERLYATGTGTTVAPGALVFEGAITDADITAALAL